MHVDDLRVQVIEQSQEKRREMLANCSSWLSKLSGCAGSSGLEIFSAAASDAPMEIYCSHSILLKKRAYSRF